MSETWRATNLADVTSLEYGAALPAHSRTNGDVPVFGSNGEVGRHSASLVRGPGIVIGRKGTVGAVTWSPSDFWPIDTTYFVAARTGVDIRWLYWVLSVLGLERFDSSTGVPGLNRYDAYRCQVKVPSLYEQGMIAKILDALDDRIRLQSATIAKFEVIHEQLCDDLSSRGVDKDGRLRSDRVPGKSTKHTPLGDLPSCWNVERARDVCLAIVDCRNRTPPLAGQGHPVIRTPNVRNGEFVYDRLVYTDPQSYTKWIQRGAPVPGDVLITREAPVGEACLLPADLPLACLGQRMMMYRADPWRMSNEFLVMALNSARVQRVLLDVAGGSTVGHVRVGDIRDLTVPVPPIDEQHKIAQIWRSSRHRLRAERAELAKLRTFRNGLVSDLLTGRVRVPVEVTV